MSLDREVNQVSFWLSFKYTATIFIFYNQQKRNKISKLMIHECYGKECLESHSVSYYR